MRVALAMLGGLNLIGAFLLYASSSVLYSGTMVRFQSRQIELREAGALIEQPEAIGADRQDEWWLMRELLPYLDQRLSQMFGWISLGLLIQGVVLLAMAYQLDKAKRDTARPAG